MIKYTNIVKHTNQSWESYIGTSGFSHSFLKSEANGINRRIEPTAGMRLGSMVDAILCDGMVDMASDLYPVARNISATIRDNFGSLLSFFEKQVSYTAEAEFKGFKMPVKGRLDFLLPGNAVIDLKVIKAKDITPMIKLFGYGNQIWHYSKMAQVPKAYLMVYSTSLKTTKVIPVPVDSDYNDFWAEKIIKFGTYGE